ncbi:TIGR03016 family PEP-CTERM system-associated outer membrane protein [Elioraea thermophila]|uniref:TIGR03016 family PEP-CTERM system-associated outer membrane protein n=1 Tax=Elioraea thermophila TaxID=2185104 RepID=UPI000DF3EB5E|nr:TIGR03016 family PEP-CTERM system-associated outer membrane protein [Elioraea thermophila]
MVLASLLSAGRPAGAQVEASPAPSAAAAPAPRPAAAPPAVDPSAGLRPGGLGFPFTTVGGLPVGQVGWFVQPSLGVSVGFDDNVRFTARDRKSDVFVSVSPGILVRGDTPRITTTLSYTPVATFYLSRSEENRLSHFGTARALATVVQDRLFLDARAAASSSDLFGAFGDDTVGGARRNQIQTVSASISPYAVQRFGGLAVARAGYIFNITDQSRQDTSRPVLIDDPVFGPIRARSFSPSSFISHTGYLTVTSGEDFGRLLLTGNLQGTTFDGDGIYDGARRWEAAVGAGYGLTRWLFVLGEVGYENIKYNTVPKTDISGMIWSTGVRLVPSDTSEVTVRYGRRDGYEAWQGDGATNLFGPRTRLSVSYSDRLTNSALRAAELLQTTTLDPFGNPIFTASGTPAPLSGNAGLLGFQDGLYRTRTASASIRHTLERDVFVLSVTHENRRPYAADPRSRLQTPTDGTSIGLSWSRPLDELTNLTSYVRYGVRSIGAGRGGDSSFYSAGAVLTHAFSETLSGALSYRLDVREDDVGDDTIYRNLVVASLRKTF